MEKFLRQYGLYLKLGLIAMMAFLSAYAVSQLFSSQLAPLTVPAIKVEKPNKKKTTRRKRAPVAATYSFKIARRCLFGCPEEDDKPKACEPACEEGMSCVEGECKPNEVAGEPLPSDVPVPSDLNVKLMGVIVASVPEFSTAFVQGGGNKNYEVGVGDMLEGAEVAAIKRERVIIKRNNRLEYISLESSNIGNSTTGTRPAFNPKAGGVTTGEPSKPSVEKPETEPARKGVRVLDAEQFKRELSNPSKMASQATVLPNYKNNRKSGLKVIGITNNSVFKELGVENGDVVQRINGLSVRSRAQAAEMLQGAANQKRLSVEVERGGKTRTLKFNFK